MISIHMLKICNESICKPSELIFQYCMKHRKFTNEWKMANVLPVHKKSEKQILKNYRPVSLLPFCGKIFERLINNSLFEYFIENVLISPSQYSKALHNVWHNGPMNKLKQNGLAGDLLDSLTNFLKERKQRVILNGQHSTWANVEAGVPQGSILGPLLLI